ncbi:MAG: alpha/beta hydrolase [Bacteroidaceae bacterium]|nr:alpha/beta hydrolase [Bacteroidaceae bacterium]
MFRTLLLLIPLIILPSRDSMRPWAKDDIRADEVIFTPYLADDSLNAPTVIVCPGGSYCWLDVKGEGIEVSEWLRDNGISAFLLQYRTAGFGAYFTRYRYVARGNRHPDMICDVQRAIRYVRENSDSFGVDPNRVGVMGFSAGGHLAMSAACFSDTDYTDLPQGPASVSLRPDFVAAIYPVVTMKGNYAHKRSRRGLLGEWGKYRDKLREQMSIEENIPSDCPPVFMINCKDDPVVDWHNSVLLDEALSKAGIEHKYIQYETGLHGFGVSEVYGSEESRKWKDEFLEWLKPFMNK